MMRILHEQTVRPTYIALHCIILHINITLHYIALHYITLRYITQHHITLPQILTGDSAQELPKVWELGTGTQRHSGLSLEVGYENGRLNPKPLTLNPQPWASSPAATPDMAQGMPVMGSR